MDQFELGHVMVSTTTNGGHTPEFWAEQATNKICSVSDSAPEHIKQQANAFRNAIYDVVLSAMKSAVASDRVTISATLSLQGHDDMAKIVKEL
jgi:hypothetical protein|tara:strand:+ start:2775 stop:3053 length:279 start_codon:yes stop_codon:yes gene_type:complete